eukprot:gnl/Dysnectes_brevis/3294_a4132_1018.p1 GENE.gnl/Dysnectes_brevis/3294_a4132_1018~~gnl/Dysnectes_brevis/3294_a4132_1018.p1  ORF type:complete len:330 (+),score=56.12 gnl/Dysnectes_brevis/3294_a4132_1018:145-990(+)
MDDVAHYEIKSNPRDLVTEADRLSQRLIVGGLRRVFPDLTYVGEEGPMVPTTPLSIRHASSIPHLVKIPSPYAIPMGSPVWIDPLDGTHSYVHSKFNEVGICIGVADPITGTPIAGVLSFPFREGIDSLYYGAAGCGTSPQVKKAQVGPGHHPLIMMSCDEDPILVDALTRRFEGGGLGSPVFQCPSGAANKLEALLSGKAAGYLYPRKGLCRWDTLAAHAIANSAGFIVESGYGDGSKVLYQSKCSEPIHGGLIAGSSEEVVAAMRAAINDFNKIKRAPQ